MAVLDDSEGKTGAGVEVVEGGDDEGEVEVVGRGSRERVGEDRGREGV